MRRSLLLVGLAAAALLAAADWAGTREPEQARVWVEPGLAKVRPEARPPRPEPRSIRLTLLRGECELAHVAVRAAAAPLEVSARVEGAAEGATVRLYREELVALAKASGPDGAAGRWPDPLVPAVDAYAGEARRAFPLAVPARAARAILVEACASHEAAPGRRRLAVRVEGSVGARLPVALEILPQAIPATSSLRTSFGLSSRRAALGHHGRTGTDEEIAALDRRYRTALLAHRLSAHGGSMDAPPFRREAGGLALDLAAYDREVGPFLSGAALPSGARATTTELRTHPALASDDERVAYWRAIARHHEARGWDALLFDYARDEPRREELPAVAARARLVRRADPRIAVLLTSSFDPSLDGLVDLWTPNLNCLFVKDRPEEFCPWRAPRESYRSGKALWWYVSCSSHGCDERPPSPYFRGWPGYAIDLPAARARAMGWLAFREGIAGELYWDTVYAYAPGGQPKDPWDGAALRAFGGNGDGTLFYPGTPRRVGGESHVPVESLRLKHVRDGLEDLELLRLVAAAPGGAELAAREAARLAPAPFRLAEDPAAWAEVRGRLLAALRKPR